MVGFRVPDWPSTQARSRRLAEGRRCLCPFCGTGGARTRIRLPATHRIGSQEILGWQILSKISR
jgi:hypothetical protein